MKPFAVLIFEINTGESEPFARTKLGNFVKRVVHQQNLGWATIWLHVATEEKWKTSIPNEMEKSCVKVNAPLRWQEAEVLMRNLKSSFAQLGVECYELTCSDD